jgi:hypothetical protein
VFHSRRSAGLLAIGVCVLVFASCAKRTSDTGAVQSDIPLLSVLGSLHFPISTKNAEAQKYFDQGMLLYYALNLYDARRSFEHASKIDPAAAMPYWGIALVLGPTYNGGVYASSANEEAAFAAIQKARKLAARNASDRERDYIAALAQRFTDSSQPDLVVLEQNYARNMRDLSQRYPDDPDARTLYAESMMDFRPYHLWTPERKPAENTVEIESALEDVLSKWPNHIGANHYYIHLMEASPHPEKALGSARLLETAAPRAGHLVHMPCHIYMNIGDYAAAVRMGLAATKADDSYLRSTDKNDFAYVVGYAQHNMLLLTRAAGMTGEFAVAYQAAVDLETQAQQHLDDGGGEDAYFVPKILVLARFARWDDILKLPPPNEDLYGVIFFWHYARASALAAKGRVRDAEAERDAMETTYAAIVPSQTFGMLFGDWSSEYNVASYAIDARIFAARGQTREEIERWQAAVKEQDQMEYHEPAGWYYPVRESLGAALLRSGQAVEAEKVFRSDLVKNPHNPRSLFGLARALEAREKSAEAKMVQAEFGSVWKGSRLRIEDF